MSTPSTPPLAAVAGATATPAASAPAAPAGVPGAEPRAMAARILDAVLHRGRSLKAEFGLQLPKLPDPRDRALVEAICFSVLRQHPRYDASLQQWVQRPLGQRDGELRALLFAGFAQLDVLGLPAHAAVAATVEAARLLDRPHQAGMVNALLRRAQRDGFSEADPALAWPTWLRERVRADWPGEADAVFRASAVPAPLWLRVNRARADREAMRVRLADAGIEAFADDLAVDALRIDAPVAVSALPGFDDGLLSVQDGAAQRVADALAPAPGARVLDACAAPGGKSAHLLERDPSLRLTALDNDARRLRRVAETFTRTGVGADVDLQAVDATDLDAWWDYVPFDAIVIDAPCSATGVVRRQPDVLLHRQPRDIDSLVRGQARLLDALWPALREGGTLVYATCSILKAENEHQVFAFLGRHDDAVLAPLDAGFGQDRSVGRQRLPGEHGFDGFFYARFTKAGRTPT